MSVTSPAQGARILVVDDEADFRALLALSLKRKGYQVVTAEDGRQAYDLLTRQSFDAIISDIVMPGGSGVELLERARLKHFATPVLLLVTGFSDLTTEEAFHKGADAMFSKPFNGNALYEMISRLLTPPERRWAAEELPRVKMELSIQLQVLGLPDAIEAKVVNLGRGGIYVALEQGPFPNVNDSVAFTIRFHEKTSDIQGNGHVKWVRMEDEAGFPAGCGIEFTHLLPKDRELILGLISQLKPVPFIPRGPRE